MEQPYIPYIPSMRTPPILDAEAGSNCERDGTPRVLALCGKRGPLMGAASPGPKDQPSCRRDAPTRDDPSRVPYPPGETSDFAALTAKAVVMVAEQVGGIHGVLLEMLGDCEAPPLTTGAWQQRGASYKSLAAIAYRVGMTKAERIQWYWIAEAIPLSQRHAGHILRELQRAAA